MDPRRRSHQLVGSDSQTRVLFVFYAFKVVPCIVEDVCALCIKLLIISCTLYWMLGMYFMLYV
ncbi:hypothetical protein Hanom_Chr01g00045421 [Helianthus anomalus]